MTGSQETMCAQGRRPENKLTLTLGVSLIKVVVSLQFKTCSRSVAFFFNPQTVWNWNNYVLFDSFIYFFVCGEEQSLKKMKLYIFIVISDIT